MEVWESTGITGIIMELLGIIGIIMELLGGVDGSQEI